MSRPARWECSACQRLLGEIECGRLRIARAVEVIYATSRGIAVCCPACESPREWVFEYAAALATSAPAI